MTCDRCGCETRIHITSMFNIDVICPSCKDEERRHPDYERAVQIEAEALCNGDFNFPGIGLPGDLRRR